MYTKPRGNCATCGSEISPGAKHCAEHSARGGHTPEQRDKHALCGAKKKNGEPCRAFSGQNTDHFGIGPCWVHGGATSGHRKHAVTLEAKARMIKLGAPLDEREAQPHRVLLNLLRATAGHVAWLHAEIGQLEDVGTHEAQVLLRMYDDERDRAARIAKACSEAGVEEAQVRMTQREANELVFFLEAVFEDLPLSSGQRAAAGPAIRKRLPLLSGGEPDSSHDGRISEALAQDGPPAEWFEAPADAA